jgi:hypothetical protein
LRRLTSCYSRVDYDLEFNKHHIKPFFSRAIIGFATTGAYPP